MPDPSLSWILPAAKEAYENREAIQGLWTKLASQLFGKRQSLAFTGVAGVGKTVLFDHLTGVAYRAGYAPPGTSQSKETGRLSRARKRIRFSVIPGQDSAPRFDATDDLFGEHAVDGVVHVVANGFTAVRSVVARETLVRDAGLTSLVAFRSYQRSQELEDLDETCELIRTSLRAGDKPRWLIVAVDKVDLYYDEIHDAERYYSPGSGSPFAKRLEQLQDRVGRDRFDWVAVPVCSWLEDFDWNGDLAPSRLKPKERDYYIGQLLRLIESYSAR